ncbi:MAG TPA: peroxiredoxin [Gaiellaceae bacterium]|jgi:peroxiredoxin|nr:peroxiredoxin [Gaiellaceae bacterium]
MNSLDAYLPSYEYSTRHEVAVDAPSDVADRALREVTFRDVPVVRALLFARGEGAHRADEPVVATMVPKATVVEDAPGEGIVLSVTGQFWRLRGRGPEPPATAVVDFRSGPGRLSTETRVHVPDPVSRRKFERYWRIVRPFSGLIRMSLLRAAKRRAERQGSDPGGARPRQFDPHVLPGGLPEPEDDGAADHLAGAELPDLVLPSSQGGVNVRDFEVLYVYPRTGKPGVPSLPGWDDIPGARGCTPQSCGFRDHSAELAALGARVAGVSAQSLDDQLEFAERNAMPFPVISDEWLDLARDPGLPTFDVEGLTLYKRLALVAESGRIVKVFYPVFPPDRNAQDVLEWLEARA